MLQDRYEQIENALEATTDTGSFIDLVTSQLRMLRIVDRLLGDAAQTSSRHGMTKITNAPTSTSVNHNIALSSAVSALLCLLVPGPDRLLDLAPQRLFLPDTFTLLRSHVAKQIAGKSIPHCR